jgi:hypothetical protein
VSESVLVHSALALVVDHFQFTPGYPMLSAFDGGELERG